MPWPADVLIAVQLAMELGVAPMQGLQSIAVINGRPTIWGDLLPALVYQSGLCEQFLEEGDETEARCTVKRKGYAAITRSFSMEDARRVPYKESNDPSVKCLADKSTYKGYPKRMLQMRARAFAIRDAFPDVLKGVGIREETEDIPTTAVDVTPPYDQIQPPQRRSEQKEATDEPQQSSTDHSDGDQGAVRADDSGETTPKQKETKETPGQEERVPEKAMIEQMRDWLKTAPIQQVMGQKSFISTNLASLSQDDQMQICKEWNARKKEIRDAAETKG